MGHRMVGGGSIGWAVGCYRELFAWGVAIRIIRGAMTVAEVLNRKEDNFLSKISIQGFKSIHEIQELELGLVNVEIRGEW